MVLRWILLLTALWATVVGAWAQSVVISGPTNVNAASNASYTVTVHPGPASVYEVGVRLSPSAAMGSVTATTSLPPITQTTSLQSFTYNARFGARQTRINLNVLYASAFRGAVALEAYIKIPGATTDLMTQTLRTSVGQIPAPTVISPATGDTVSAAPTFRVSSSTSVAQPVTYQIEMTRGTLVRTVTTAVANTNANFNHFTPYTGGYPGGNYSFRVRAVDANGTAGLWSAPRTIVVSGGIDAAGSISLANFINFKNAGWDSHFQAAWGGRNRWSSARQNLLNAHAAGMKVAAYAFLNFDNGSTIAGAPANQTGSWQVDQGLIAIGYDFTIGKSSLPYDLKYFMIDLENQFMGTMSTADRVQRIAEAVQRARNLGFWPMIYTRNQGSNQWWNTYTGSSTDFSDLPLWASYPELETAVYKDILDLDAGSPWVRFGGWTTRAGKQYLLDRPTFGVGVDFNVWDPAIWTVNSPNPGLPNLGVLSSSVVRNANGTYTVTINLRNSGTCEAYAVRLRNATLGGTSLAATTSLRTIGAGVTRSATLTFPSTAGASGNRVTFGVNVWTGMGSVSYVTQLTLP